MRTVLQYFPLMNPVYVAEVGDQKPEVRTRDPRAEIRVQIF